MATGPADGHWGRDARADSDTERQTDLLTRYRFRHTDPEAHARLETQRRSSRYGTNPSFPPDPPPGRGRTSSPCLPNALYKPPEIRSISGENEDDRVQLTQAPPPTDVREPGELKSTGRVPGAVNIPVTSQPDSFHISEEDFEDRFGYPRPAKDQEVVFYCKAGVRSRAAAGLAKDAGWARVGEYPGSWLDWAEKGGKVER